MTTEPIDKAAVKPGKHGHASAFDSASTNDFSSFVFDQTKVFLRAAQTRDLNFLVYLLEMVAVEAARLRDDH